MRSRLLSCGRSARRRPRTSYRRPITSQDGLVAQWDGIENAGPGLHDDAAATWVDISAAKKGGDFTVNAGDVFTANALRVLSKPNQKYVTGSLGLTAMTVEVVAMRTEGAVSIRRFDVPGGDTTFESWSSETEGLLERIGGTRLHTVAKTASNNTRYTFVTRYDVAGGYHDFLTSVNDTVTRATPTYAQAAQPTDTNGRTIPDQLEFFKLATNITFFAVRIYNRRLTDVELARNRHLDCARFGEAAANLGEAVPTGAIRFSGAQSFDTGWKVGPNTRIVADFAFTDTSTAQQFVWEANGGMCCRIYVNGKLGYSFAYNDGSGIWTTFSDDKITATRYLGILDAKLNQARLVNAWTGAVKYNQDSVMAGKAKTKTSTSTLKIGSRYDMTANFANMWLFGFQIFEGGALVRDYVPCVSNRTHIGLYDRVAKTFAGSSTTKAFDGWSGDILQLGPGEDDPCLVSVGGANQFINTQYNPTPETCIEVDFAVNELKKQGRVFGSQGTGSQTVLYQNDDGYFSFSAGDEFLGHATTLPVDSCVRRTAILDYPAMRCSLLTNGSETNATVEITAAPTAAASAPLGLFGAITAASGLSASAPLAMRLYGAKIYEAGELVHEFVPCVKGGVAGLKDLSTGAFLTGEGPALTPQGNVTVEADDGYIESTGIGYIDSQYTVKPNTRIEFDGCFLADTSLMATTLFGNYNNNGINAAVNLNDQGQLYTICTNGTAEKWPSQGLSYTGIYLADHLLARRTYVLDVKNSAFSLLAGTYTNYTRRLSTVHDMTATKSFLFFAASNNGTAEKPSKARMYGCRIYEDDVLVKNYVPEIVNAAPGLRETESGSFLVPPRTAYNRYNAGGNVTQDTQSKDAYLEFTGAQAIDTGVVCDNSSCMKADFSFTQLASNEPDQPFVAEGHGKDSGGSTKALRMGYISGSDATTGILRYGIQSEYRDAVTPLTFQRYRGLIDLKNRIVKFTSNGSPVKDDSSYWKSKAIVENTSTLKIGSANGMNAHFAKMRLYGFKIWSGGENGNLVRDFVPYKAGEVIGLYDLVSGEVFTNVAVTTQTPFRIGGRGFGADRADFAFVTTNRVEKDATTTLRAFAPGAVSYQWYRGEEPIVGATGDSLDVAWERGVKSVDFAVEAVFDGGGVAERSTRVTTPVAYGQSGLVIFVR